jgi:hypothetical protein
VVAFGKMVWEVMSEKDRKLSLYFAFCGFCTACVFNFSVCMYMCVNTYVPNIFCIFLVLDFRATTLLI